MSEIKTWNLISICLYAIHDLKKIANMTGNGISAITSVSATSKQTQNTQQRSQQHTVRCTTWIWLLTRNILT